MENADTAMTAVGIGTAVAVGAASTIAPEHVAAGRNTCNRWVDKFKQTHPILVNVVSIVNATLNLALYFLDIVTDIVLLLVFMKHGWLFCSIWSICFIAIPYLIAMYGIFKVRKTAFKDLNIVWYDGYDTFKKMLLVIFTPILPLLFDIYMPFHRLLNEYIGDNFSNFMTQYEATRTVSETILESMPQLGLQIYMIIYCRTYGCNFQTDGDDGDDTALARAFIISISCIVYRIVLTWYEIQKENITLKEYFIQLVKMGEGIPLSKIANNEIDKLDLTDMDLTVAQVRLLIKVLKNNTSLKMLEMPWYKLDEESIELLFKVKHGATIKNKLIIACEKGHFDAVKLLISRRNNDVNGSNGNNNNMTLKEYVNQVGKNSGGYHTPLMIAARNEHFQIVKYLIEQGEADPNIADSDGWNALHSARITKRIRLS